MRSVVRSFIVLFLALIGSISVRGQTTLNLSQDLVTLGIATRCQWFSPAVGPAVTRQRRAALAPYPVLIEGGISRS